MKTKELIAMLQKEDPTGEEHVCVHNVDIRWVSNEPAYYDGAQQIFIKDEKGRVIGGKYHRSGRKIQIHTTKFSDLLWDRHEEFVIDYSELGQDRQESYKKDHEEIIKKAKELDLELEIEYFVKHIKERAEKITDCAEYDVTEIAKEFYMQNFNPYMDFPADIPWTGNSYVDRRNIQWGRIVDVTYDWDNGIKLTRKPMD